MTLTIDLKNPNSPIRQFMEYIFPNHRAVQKACRQQIVSTDTLRPSMPVPYSTIGMAIDYRIRYYFKITKCDSLTAFYGAGHSGSGGFGPFFDQYLLLTGTLPSDEIRRISEARANNRVAVTNAEFFVSLDKAMQKIQPAGRRLHYEEECQIARYCVTLALFEEIFRSNPPSSPLNTYYFDSVDDLLAFADDHWVEDLCQLSWRFFDNFSHLLTLPNVVLNPGFRSPRGLMAGGGDGDLIVDGCLIDIKTTLDPSLDKLWLYQLLCYTLADHEDKYHIRKVAILYARQGIILTWELDDLLSIMCNSSSPIDLQELKQQYYSWRLP